MLIEDWAQAQAVALRILLLSRETPSDECEPLWDALVRWLQKKLPGVVAHVSSALEQDLREDALQEALISVYQGIHTYDSQRASFKTWVEHVAIHATYRVLKRRGRIRIWEQQEPAEDAYLDDEPRPMEDLIADPTDYQTLLIQLERARLLLECARRVLSSEELLVFEEVLRGETSYEELSQLLGKRADALRQQFSRAREKTLAEALLHPQIFTNVEIQEAVDACQQSSNPLTERELAAVQETLCGNPHRKRPSHRNTQHFRNACVKLAPYLLRHFAVLFLILYSLLTYGANSVTNIAGAVYRTTENDDYCARCASRRSI